MFKKSLPPRHNISLSQNEKTVPRRFFLFVKSLFVIPAHPAPPSFNVIPVSGLTLTLSSFPRIAHRPTLVIPAQAGIHCPAGTYSPPPLAEVKINYNDLDKINPDNAVYKRYMSHPTQPLAWVKIKYNDLDKRSAGNDVYK